MAGTRMTRQAAARHALRAVGRITFTLGAVGCIESPTLGEGGEYVDGDLFDDASLGDVANDDIISAGMSADGMAVDGMAVDAEVEGADAGWGRDAEIEWVAEDAWVDEVDLGVDGEVEADALPDAISGEADAQPPCPSSDTDHDAWLKCCEERGWGSDPTCFAWGPPTPPAMPGPGGEEWV